MIDIKATTELEAVNTILDAVLETQVNTITAGNDAVVKSAIGYLNEASRSLQQKGWVFNTIKEYKLTPDASKFIHIPDSISQVTLAGSSVSIRQRKLFNLTDNTFEFSGVQTVSVVQRLSFDDLPDAARHYVTIKAAARAQDDKIPDNLTYRITQRNVAEAWSGFRTEDTRASASNFR